MPEGSAPPPGPVDGSLITTGLDTVPSDFTVKRTTSVACDTQSVLPLGEYSGPSAATLPSPR